MTSKRWHRPNQRLQLGRAEPYRGGPSCRQYLEWAALRQIWGGQAGGFPAIFASLIGEMRGIEYAPITLEVAEDLAYWRAEIPGCVVARAEALTGPMTPPGKRVPTLNAPGSETGPGTVATWGRATADTVKAFGFTWEWAGRSTSTFPSIGPGRTSPEPPSP